MIILFYTYSEGKKIDNQKTKTINGFVLSKGSCLRSWGSEILFVGWAPEIAVSVDILATLCENKDYGEESNS